MSSKSTGNNRAAFDAATKKPRVMHVDIILNDEIAEAYENAEAKLQRLERELLDTRARRVAAVRAGLPSSMTPEDQAEQLAVVHEEDQQQIDDARKELATLAESLQAATQRFVFRALGRRAWEELKAAHPPTETDHDTIRETTGKADAKAEYCFDTLAPDLVQKSAVSPVLSEETVEAMFETWNDEELARLFQTALMAQITARQNPVAR